MVLVVASGGAVGEVLDEALFIFLASPPRGGLAASTLSTPAPGLDSCLAVPCEEERIPRCGRRPAKLIKFTLGLQLVFRKQKKFAQSSPVGWIMWQKVCTRFAMGFQEAKKSLH